MAKPEEVEVGKRFRVTRTFTDEWISNVINFDDGLHEPVTVREGAEGIVHSLRTPDGNGHVDAYYPDIPAWPQEPNGGIRIQTHISDIEMLG